MRALISGDGPSAAVATLALHGAGADIVRALPRRSIGVKRHFWHFRMVGPEIARSAMDFDQTLAEQLVEATVEDARLADTGKGWAEGIARRIPDRSVVAALRRRFRDLSFEDWHDATLTDRDGARLVAQSPEGRGAFDMVVDATGGYRATRTMQLPDFEAGVIEDAAKPRRYLTVEVTLPDAVPGMSWIAHPPHDSEASLYGDSHGKVMRFTGSVADETFSEVRSLPDLGRVFGNDRLPALLPQGAQLTGLLTTVAPTKRRWAVPPKGRRGWIAFGDALFQASPRTGVGFASIFLQGQVLAAAARARDSADLIHARLESTIERLWRSPGPLPLL